jgi:hypothetical protein
MPNHSGETQNFFATGNDGQYAYNQPMGRWDHLAGDKDRFYAMFTFQHGHEFRNQNGFAAPAMQGNIWSQRTQQTYIADWTRIFTPAAVLDLRASFGRFTQIFPDGPPDEITASSLGITMPHPPTTSTDTAPRIQLNNYSDIIGNLYTWTTKTSGTSRPASHSLPASTPVTSDSSTFMRASAPATSAAPTGSSNLITAGRSNTLTGTAIGSMAAASPVSCSGSR